VECDLKEAERAPPPVIQPLPQQQDKAQQWLFFLHMPPLFRHLSRTSFLAQQMLLPRQLSDTSHSAMLVQGLSTSLVGHYNSHQKCCYHTPSKHRSGEDGKVQFRSRLSPPDTKDIGPRHIDSFKSQSDGVCYPDSLSPSLCWAGAGSPADQPQLSGHYHDPFVPISKQGKCSCEGLSLTHGCAVAAAQIVLSPHPNASCALTLIHCFYVILGAVAELELSFTEQLPGEEGKKLQWTMHTAESYTAQLLSAATCLWPS
jgi:hypothetical protein